MGSTSEGLVAEFKDVVLLKPSFDCSSSQGAEPQFSHPYI